MDKLLSVCIPTYNRSRQLDALLNALTEQAVPYAGIVEIVVVDNGSDFDCRKIVNGHSQIFPIKYHGRKVNVGAVLNVVEIATFGSGKYCWLIGDDDLLSKGALREIIECLSGDQDFAAIVVGCSFEKNDRRDAVIRNGSDSKRNLFANSGKNRKVVDWSETFNFTNKPALYSYIGSVVFPRREWVKILESKRQELENPEFTSLFTTFPHAVIWAEILAHKKVLFIEDPLVYFFVGDQEWIGSWKTMLFTRVLEYADYLQELGVSPECAARYRDTVFNNSGDALYDLVTKPDGYSRRNFKFKKIIRKYRNIVSFQELLAGVFNRFTGFRSLLRFWLSSEREIPFSVLIKGMLRILALKVRGKIK